MMKKATVPEQAFDWFADPAGDDSRPAPEPKRRRQSDKDEADEKDPAKSSPRTRFGAKTEQSQSTDELAADQPPPTPERTERELRAEIAAERRRQRVALAELIDRLPEEVRVRITASLNLAERSWWLERGRYVFTRLTRTDTIDRSDGPVEVNQRFALLREAPPHQAEPVLERVTAALEADRATDELPRRLEPLRALLSDKDEIEIRLPDQEQPAVITVTAQAITVERPTDTPETMPVGADQPIPDTEQAAVESEHAGLADEPVTGADRPEPVETMPESEGEAAEHAEPKARPTDQAEPAFVAATAERLWRQPDESAAGELGQAIAAESADAEVAEPNHPAIPDAASDRTIETAVDTAESVPPPDRELAKAIELLNQHGADLADLPPMGGGAPATPVTSARAVERGPAPALSGAPPRSSERPSGPLPSRSAERAIYVWEEHWHHPEQRPNDRMRRKAHQLVRILARRYGLRLTPELEAYLVRIVLRPHYFGGHKVYGLGLNRDHLLRVLSTLWLNFGDLYAYRPKP